MSDSTSPKSNDDYLQEAHDEYINTINESGMPLWVSDMYGINSMYFFSTVATHEENKNNLFDTNQDLPF